MKFQHLQRQLADHVRDQSNPPIPAIENRRFVIYQQLIFNNLNGFISSGFPVLKQLHSEAQWRALIRTFMVERACESPYFLQIGEEFLEWLTLTNAQFSAHNREMLCELAYYERLEVMLDIAEVDLLPQQLPHCEDLGEELLHRSLTLSPLAKNCSFHWPVHKLCAESIPLERPNSPSCLLVWRNRSDEVRFMELNPLTHILLNRLANEAIKPVVDVLHELALEMNQALQQWLNFAADLIASLYQQDVLIDV